MATSDRRPPAHSKDEERDPSHSGEERRLWLAIFAMGLEKRDWKRATAETWIATSKHDKLRFATSVIATTGLAAAFGLPRNVYAGNEVDHSRPGIGPRCWGSIVPICRGDDAGLLTRWDRDLTCLFPS